MKTPILALVDCNNFFVSCERVFQPQLKDQPVAVLSSNDGCIIARSNNVKALDVPMGASLFKYRDVLKRHKVRLFSSNFALYGDMSRRVVATLRDLAPEVEVYSVDECFLDLTNMVIKDLGRFALNLRRQVYRCTGIPVSVGIAPTKTLAKAASTLAKSNHEGVLSLVGEPEEKIDQYLDQLPIHKVWGIGRWLTSTFIGYGIPTARSLKHVPQVWLAKNHNVTVQRTVLELRGQPTIPFGENTRLSKSIASTRSFGQPVWRLRELEQAIANFTAGAALKLRQQSGVAGEATVFISTGQHSKERYSRARQVLLSTPTADTLRLTAAVLPALKQIFKPGMRYKKAGVILHKIASAQQLSLIEPASKDTLERQERRMQVLDSVNARWGIGTVKTATEGLNQAWAAKHILRSPRYTTAWSELPSVTVH